MRPRTAPFLGILVLALAGSALADGKYFVRLADVGDDHADIPVQRALVLWQDGTETLVVESAVDSGATELAWVLPLPAVPGDIEEISTGFFPTLEHATAPGIEMGDVDGLVIAMLVIWALTAVTMLVLWFPRLNSPGCILAASIFLPFLGVVLLSSPLGGPLSGVSPSSVRVLKTETAGNFEISVLEADSATALSEWLGANGFRNPEDAELEVIADYVREGWCFVTAKLTRTENGLSRPHPILLRFNASEPVYPMKLTGVGTKEMFLELFAAGDTAWTHANLESTYCGTFERFENSQAPGYGQTVTVLRAPPRTHVAHSDVLSTLPDRFRLTRLEGTLTADNMREDFILTPGDYSKHRRIIRTRSGALERGAWVLFFGSLFSVLVAPAIGYFFFRAKRGKATALSWLAGTLLSAVVAAAAIGFHGGLYAKTPDRLPGDRQSLVFDATKTLEDFSVPSNASDEEIWSAVSKELGADLVGTADEPGNPFTRGPVTLREYPGDCIIERVDGKVYLSFLDSTCIPYRVELGTTGPTTRGAATEQQ